MSSVMAWADTAIIGREVEIWLPAIQYLSFGLLAFCIANLVIQWVLTRHPHYDIWLIGAGGIIIPH